MKIRNQKGMTLIGFIIVLSLALFVSYLAMKIGPIYVGYYGVSSAMNDMAASPGLGKRSPDQIRRDLRARMYVNYSTGVEDRNMKMVRGDGGVILRVKYEVRESVLGNLDVIVMFDKSVKLSN